MSGKINDRKLDHIRIVLEEEVEPIPSSFDSYRLPFKAFPEIDMEEIDTSTKFYDWDLSFPFIVSSMTGGPEKGLTINSNLAKACEEVGVGLGLGSMRVILRKPESIPSFDVKKFCPSVPLFANMGIVQLNYGYGADEINKIIDSINADGIFLHVNHLQEAVQPEGDLNFKDLIPKLGEILPKIEKKVVVKEVGHGFDYESAKALADIGIEWIDVSGLGGTSWAWVEAYRRDDDIGHLLKAEGIPTDESLEQCKKIEGLNLIAGGGVRNGIHIAKSVSLGAKIATAAKPLLAASLESVEACITVLEMMKHEFKLAMFSAGVSNVEELSKLELKKEK